MLSPSFGYLTYKIVTRSSPAPNTLNRVYSRHNYDLRRCARRACSSSLACKKNAFEPNEMRQRIGGNRIRDIERRAFYGSSTTTTELQLSAKEQRMTEERKQWTPVYRFLGIQKFAALSKLKFIQTAGSAILFPFIYQQYINEEISQYFFSTVVAATALAPIVLYLFTRSFNRIVGVISIDKNRETVRIGHISFWGMRQNTCVFLDDLLPLNYSPESRRSKFMRFCRHSDPRSFFLIPTSNIEIVDEKLSELVFGTNEYFQKPIEDTKSKDEEKNN